MNSNNTILKIDNLSIALEASGTDSSIELVDRLSFELRAGEVYGLVGESGCGKTVSSLAILRLLPLPILGITGGKIYFNGEELTGADVRRLREIRGRQISMIFQEPGAALNPLYTIENQMKEIFNYHETKSDPDEIILKLLEKTGIADPPRVLKSFPHELSGGMLQRVMIAMALIFNPQVLIADEPTTALDVTVQAQIMELLKEIQREHGMSVLLITHNMGLITHYADRVGVMYAGRLVEEAPVESFLEKPLHPYSQGLLAAIPDLSRAGDTLRAIPGQVPEPKNFVKGCRFYERCSQRMEKCLEQPELNEIETKRKVSCFLYDATESRAQN